MYQKEISRITIELRHTADDGWVISLNWLSRTETASRVHNIKLGPDGKRAVDTLCKAFWNSVAPAFDAASKKPYRTLFEHKPECARVLDAIRVESAKIATALFDTQALQLLWELARECRILCIQTNLLLVPWEAMVNPILRDGIFLGQLSIISRVAISGEQDISFKAEHANGRSFATYVDSVLDKKWRSDKTAKGSLYRAIRCLSSTLAFESVRELFADMRAVRLIHWICDNSFETKSKVDRLRLSEDSFLTTEMMFTDYLSSTSVMILLTCGELGRDRSQEPIGALIALRNGCTVVCPLLPIHEEIGLHLLRLSLGFQRGKWSVQLDGTPQVTIAHVVEWFMQKGVIGAPSLAGVLTLFLGIHGPATAELTS